MKSKYLSLWLILALSLIAVTTMSFIGDTTFTIKVKAAKIADSLTQPFKSSAELQAEKLAAEEAAKKATKPKPKIIPVDTAAQTILLFGDSMSENIGRRLQAYSWTNGHTLHVVNWDSSGTRIWSSCDTLDNYIRRLKPTFIFISLGGNEAAIKNPEAYRPYIEKVLAKIGKIPYIWIGPPSLKNANGSLSDMLQGMIPQGCFFRSDGMELERRRDRIHPTVPAAAIEVDSIARWMKKSGAHPIKMVLPPDSLSNTRIADMDIHYLKPVH